ncbi:hypothetical protein MTR_8g045750 [Medicago truncatula]|uniref:Uncharacterized protein n=1 Tax=Medicago truncatula TaxID=3880 RepID=A0A072TPE3_MEDTR|nr:hypothetical protein MTR_8g045750 [Medicago truncatula]
MKENGDIETMFSRFQTLVYGLQVLNKRYIVRGVFLPSGGLRLFKLLNQKKRLLSETLEMVQAEELTFLTKRFEHLKKWVQMIKLQG